MRNATLIFCLMMATAAPAQKVVSTSEQTWFGYIQQVRLAARWGLTADVHFRTADNWLQGRNLALGRIGGIYYINDNAQLAGGYTYFHYYPAEQHPLDARPEHRLWQQVMWAANGRRLRVQQRLRLEQRWRKHIESDRQIGDDYDFNWRTRMQVQLLYSLSKKPFAPRSIALMVADEPMLNFGKEIVYNTFDQNRFIAGVQVQLGTNNFVQAGYMHVFQQQSSGRTYRQSHVARIFYTHLLDVRKKTKQKR